MGFDRQADSQIFQVAKRKAGKARTIDELGMANPVLGEIAAAPRDMLKGINERVV